MYEVYLDGKLLYYPGDKVNALTAAVLDTKLNESGTLNITIPATNPLHGKFQRRISELTVFKNGAEIWNGEIRSSKGNFKKENVVTAVGELSYLTASNQPQKAYNNVNPLQMMTALLAEHNARVEERKRFAVGMVTVGAYNYDWITNYENTLEFLKKQMCEKLNAYLRIRKVDGVRYLDLVSLKDYGKSCSQPIKFGKNLLDYVSGITADSIATVIRPLGATLENSNIQGVDAYLTIESVNNGKDYLENTEAIESGIGKVWRTVHFNALTTPEALMTAGNNWLKDNQFENMSIDVTAVDLSDLNSNIETFELGDSVRIIAKPFGMDKWSYITEKKVDLLNPVIKHNISIGDSVKKTYTEQNKDAQDELKKEMPQASAILALAKQNASEIIKSVSEGNVHFVYDENGKIKEILFLDTNDIKTAQKVWRWNINGLGYSKTGYNGEYALAMTMDGAFVADLITVGTMLANRIKGGTLTLGHANNDNGRIEIFNSVGKMIGEWDCNGFMAQTDSYATTEYLPKYFENNFYNYPYYDETQGSFDVPVGDYVASYIIELEDATSEHTVYVKFKNPNVDTVFSMANTGYSADVDTIYKFTATNGRLILTVSNWFGNTSYSEHITGDMGYTQVSILYGDVEKIWSPTTGIKRVSASTGGGGTGAVNAVKYSYDNEAVKMCASGMRIDTEKGEIESDHYSITEKGLDIRLDVGDINSDTKENSRINKLNLGKNGMSMSAFEFDDNNNMSEYKYMELLTSLYEAGFKFRSPHIEGSPEGYFGVAGIKNTAVNQTTTSGGANVRITTDGNLYKYASSSKRYKKDITTEINEDLAPERLYDLNVVQYKYNDGYLAENDQRCGKDFIGFIAEEVAEKYPLACNVDGEGRPEMWEVNILFPALLKLVQDQKKQIDILNERLTKLEEGYNG